jgi:hypothetical protein
VIREKRPPGPSRIASGSCGPRSASCPSRPSPTSGSWWRVGPGRDAGRPAPGDQTAPSPTWPAAPPTGSSRRP